MLFRVFPHIFCRTLGHVWQALAAVEPKLMTSKPVEVWVPITELYMFTSLFAFTSKVLSQTYFKDRSEQKSKQTAIDDRPKPISSPINNPA